MGAMSRTVLPATVAMIYAASVSYAYVSRCSTMKSSHCDNIVPAFCSFSGRIHAADDASDSAVAGKARLSMRAGVPNHINRGKALPTESEGSTRAGFLRDIISSATVACTAVAMTGGAASRASAAEPAEEEDSISRRRFRTASPLDATVGRPRSVLQPMDNDLGQHWPLPLQEIPSTAERPFSPLVVAKEAKTETTSESAVSGLAAGAAVSTAKQLLLHPVDTVKTRLQMKRDEADGLPPNLFRGLYDGVLPPLLVGAPSGAVFFAAKDSMSTAIGNTFGGGYADLTTVAAVGLAQFPYWGIRSPAEFLKTRSQAGVSGGVGGGVAAAKAVLGEEGVQGLYTGYTSNVAYAFPADAIKFLIYGGLKRSTKEAKGGAKLSTIEAAVLGSGASMVAQAVTTPLDVVRTRVMTAQGDDEPYVGGIPGVLKTIAKDEGFGALWAGTTPRVARSVLSGAIQFGSYEFVKGLFGVEPRKL